MSRTTTSMTTRTYDSGPLPLRAIGSQKRNYKTPSPARKNSKVKSFIIHQSFSTDSGYGNEDKVWSGEENNDDTEFDTDEEEAEETEEEEEFTLHPSDPFSDTILRAQLAERVYAEFKPDSSSTSSQRQRNNAHGKRLSQELPSASSRPVKRTKTIPLDRTSLASTSQATRVGSGIPPRGVLSLLAAPLPPFACPFYTNNPKKYQKCLAVHLPTAKAVKQHILRDHKRKEYCPICGATFDSAPEARTHIAARDCELQSPLEIEGLHGDLMDRLERFEWRTRKMSEEEVWVEIFRICFPEVENLPTKARLDGSDQVVRAVIAARRFWDERGRYIVSVWLKARRLDVSGDDEEGRLRLEALEVLVARGFLERVISGMRGAQGCSEQAEGVKRAVTMP
ncbi:hypothetical protein QBC35DRAFT_508488 [Podospora australis]|uniref:C2H2-type domain-containing protein n=1 Tax=Podospora australis TaxID=1536484 RepID=A0AAN6WKZ3_9PEZI|nr:hypothetical protein QBC35DRAFT_508488 [Podospora australis]